MPDQRPVGIDEMRRSGYPRQDVAAQTQLVGNAFDKLYGHSGTLRVQQHEISQELTGGGEQIVAARCAGDGVRERFPVHVRSLPGHDRRWKTDDLSGSQPTPGNIAGGLTTVRKGARQHPENRQEVHGQQGARQGEIPTHPGLQFWNPSSAATEMVRFVRPQVFAVHFLTGQGNVIGNAVMLRSSRSARTAHYDAHDGEHIDVDVSGILQREQNLDQSGDRLLECMLATAARWTSAKRSAIRWCCAPVQRRGCRRHGRIIAMSVEQQGERSRRCARRRHRSTKRRVPCDAPVYLLAAASGGDTIVRVLKHLYVQVLVGGLAAGILVGHFAPSLGVQFKPLGDTFVAQVEC